MAYIRKRGKTWSYTVDVGKNLVTGEREQDTKGGFRTKKDAELAAADVEVQVAEGTFIKQTKKSFREFAESWLVFYAATGEVKPGSVRVRRSRLNLILKYFGGARLADIKRIDYQNMLLDLKGKYADETIISTHATAKMIFRRAIELQLLKSDPTRYSRVPRKVRTVEDIENGTELPKYMEKEELSRFLSAAKRIGVDKDYAVFMVLAYTGLRLGELIALKWKDVNLESCNISVTKTYDNINNNVRAFQLVPPKTEAGIRNIEFDNVIKKVFEDHKAQLNTFKMRYRNRFYSEGDFVFPNVNGKYPGYPLTQKDIEERMKPILAASELIPQLTPHSLRHTHTTLLAEAGATLQEIMERLGHKDDKTTRLVYMHVTKAMKRGTAAKFSDLMKNVSKK